MTYQYVILKYAMDVIFLESNLKKIDVFLAIG